MKFKGTKLEVHVLDFAGYKNIHDSPYYEGNNVFDSEKVGAEVAQANADISADAINTVNKCDMMPSELLAENEKLKHPTIQTDNTKVNSELLERYNEAVSALSSLLDRMNYIRSTGRISINIQETFRDMDIAEQVIKKASK